MDACNTGPLWLADSQPLTLHQQLAATCLRCRKSSLVTQIHFDTYQFKLIMKYVNTISFFRYAACIRRAAGYCCVQYNVCSGVINAFSLDLTAQGLTDTQCINDYITIPGNTYV